MEMNKLNVGTAAFPLAVIGIIAIMVVATALIASILPALRALKLNPVEAIRGQ